MKPESRSKTVLITGHRGFIGRHLSAYLRGTSGDLALVGIDGRTDTDADVDHQYVGDLSEPSFTGEVLRRHEPDYVIHLAGCTPPARDEQLWAGNVGLTVCLLEAMCSLQQNSPRVLLIGSAAEYGPVESGRISERHPERPATVYGHTKLAQTILCRHYAVQRGVHALVARPFNLIGPGMSTNLVVGSLCRQLATAANGGDACLGDPRPARDFVDVRDAVPALWLLVQHGRAGECYNVCTGTAWTVAEIAERACALTGHTAKVRFDTDRRRVGDVSWSCGAPAELLRDLGWKPEVPLDQSLSDTLARYREPSAPTVNARSKDV